MYKCKIHSQEAQYVDSALLHTINELKIFDDDASRNEKFVGLYCLQDFRESVSNILEKIGSGWVIQLASQMGLQTSFSVDKLPCRVMIQGSVVLGVSSRVGDVDSVLLVPNFVNREDFFESFLPALKQSKHFADIVAVPETYVPLIRMFFGPVKIDLVFSCLGSQFVPRNISFDQPATELYQRMDPVSIRSLSGIHLAKHLNALASQVPLFPALLRTVRAWVSARAIGDYIYGFPSSVAWAIMAAYICKHSLDTTTQFSSTKCTKPCAFCICGTLTSEGAVGVGRQGSGFRRTQTVAQVRRHHSITCLVYMFFAQFSVWQWPDPVMLTPISVVADINIFSWDPQRNSQDERDLMPIITPVFPNKNAAFTVRQTTRQIVVDEFKRAYLVMRHILNGASTWSDLFIPYDPRNHYRHFIHLTLRVGSSNLFNVLGGLIDSRIRNLAQTLEDHQLILSARIVPVRRPHATKQNPSLALTAGQRTYVRQWLVALSIKATYFGVVHEVDITGCLSTFYQILREREPFANFAEVLSHGYLTRVGPLTSSEDHFQLGKDGTGRIVRVTSQTGITKNVSQQ